MLLNCHTYFSFHYGVLSPEELLNEIASKGYRSFVLSDINNTSACLEIVRLAPGYNLKPLLGIDFRNGIQPCYVGIAKNNLGFKELNEHLTEHLHAGLRFGSQAPAFQNVFVVYPLSVYPGMRLGENEFVGVSLDELQRLPFFRTKIPPEKLVALQPLSFITQRHFNTHRLLRAIDKNTLLSKLPRTEQANSGEKIPSLSEMLAGYADYPFIIRNTARVFEESEIHFEFGKLSNKNKTSYTRTVAKDLKLLRALCMIGIPHRYGAASPDIRSRVEKELKIIQQMNFASYFLINWRITRYAQRKQYYYVGRGSGANSIVAYLLKITDVDPIDLDLYFERFINPFRNSAPDFDIDFSWTDRDDITAFIFKRFKNEHTALLATYSTFKKDSVIRELGKVFGLPAQEIDMLQSPDGYSQAGELGKQVLRYGELIENMPNHLSVHSSGIIISEAPISCYTATILPPKGYPTTQFSMLEAEDIGLYKLDILSQRGLGKIKDTLRFVKENKGAEVDIHNITKIKNDQKVRELLMEGKCIGCFYIESPAMRMLLSKLQTKDYLGLVAASSIIRPGVAKSGMMRAYILRYRNPAIREQLKAEMPELYEILQETYGVMVYQEDVIKVAHFFAGLTLAEADYLRRGMSWKFKQRNEFALVKEKFFANCSVKGYPEQTVLAIWTQIETFANFAFSKGHSASYAVESYQALFLKAYYPLEYMVATLNNGGGFYRTEIYLHEARMHGAAIVSPCVNTSTGLCTLKDRTIFLGLNMISELEQGLVLTLLEERSRNGLFQDLADFVKRVPVSIEQLRLLIRAGTFRFTGLTNAALLWEVHSLLSSAERSVPAKQLFDVAVKEYALPELTVSAVNDAMDEREVFGFFLCSPLSMLREKIPPGVKAKELPLHIGRTIEMTGFLVTVKNTGTSKGERMHFGTFLDEDGNWIDTVHFPPSAKAWPFTGPGCYRLKGKVVQEFDFISIEVSEMIRLPYLMRDDVE